MVIACAALTSCGGGDNDTPTAYDQSVAGPEETVIKGTLQATDPHGKALMFATLVPPSQGQLVVQSDGTFQYQPQPEFHGTDSFTFRASNPSGASASAVVSIVVAPVNDPPSLTSAALTTAEDTDLSATLTATDPDGATVTFTPASNPGHGQLTAFSANGALTYHPNLGYFGTDTFQVTTSDPSGESTTAQVTITVNKVIEPPVAVNQIFSLPDGAPTVVDVRSGDEDLDADQLTVAIEGAPTTGTASVGADSKVTLNLPAGFRGFTRFRYHISDPDQVSPSATALVFVNATPIRVAWFGDEFTPKTPEIALSDLISSRAVNAPLSTSQTIGSLVFRVNSSQPSVGYVAYSNGSSTGQAYSILLSAPGSASTISQSAASIEDLSSDGAWALYSPDGASSWLAHIGTSDVPTAINPMPVCQGVFGPVAADIFLECSQPLPTFLNPTYYHSLIAAPTVVTQLSPPLGVAQPPTQPLVTPDGNRVLYYTTRTDASGPYFAIFRADVAAPQQEVRLSQRFTPNTQGIAGQLQFSPDGRKLLYSAGDTADPEFCQLYLVDLANPAPPTRVTTTHGNTSCPIPAAFSPDSMRLVYTVPPPGPTFWVAVYEVTLSNPGSAVQILPAQANVGYNLVTYDESGNDLLYLANVPNSGSVSSYNLYEWHRSTNAVVQLNPNATPVSSFQRSDDGTMIVFTSPRAVNAPSDLYVMNRLTPGQATSISSPAAQLQFQNNIGFFVTTK